MPYGVTFASAATPGETTPSSLRGSAYPASRIAGIIFIIALAHQHVKKRFIRVLTTIKT